MAAASWEAGKMREAVLTKVEAGMLREALEKQRGWLERMAGADKRKLEQLDRLAELIDSGKRITVAL
jgi:hypothetical protein